MPKRSIFILALLVLVLVGGFAWRLLDASSADVPNAIAPGSEGHASEPDHELSSAVGERNAGRTAGDGSQSVGLNRRAGTLAGQCITYLDQAPLVDVVVTFSREKKPVATATSDPEGLFSVELPFGGFDLATVRTPAGWWCVEHGIVDGAYRVLLAPSDVGPLRANLIDGQTSERVPHYYLRVVDSQGWSETLMSDSEGRIESEQFFTRGPLAIHVLPEEIGGQRTGYVSSHHEHVPDGWEPALGSIALRVGPTYRLKLGNPGGVPVNRLRAYLTSPAWVDEVVEAPTRAVSVRAGDPLWTRFAQPFPGLVDPQLVITDSGGQWLGVAPVQATAGIQDKPVEVTMMRMLRVRGRVFDLNGEAVTRADVELIPKGAGADARTRQGATNARGLFILEGVRPGAYELFARHAREGMARQSVELSPAANDVLEVHLEPYPVAGDVAGVVRSLTGEFNGDLTVSLWPLDETENDMPMRSIRISWQKTGATYEGHFRFEGVARGQYQLETFLRRANFDISPPASQVSPPDESIELLVRDDMPRFRLDFLVLDAVTDEWLDESQVRILDSAGVVAYEGPAMGWAASRLFADGEPMAWKVYHPGYHAQFGSRAEFDKLSEDGEHTAIIRLEKD